jgi:hypothetical protein
MGLSSIGKRLMKTFGEDHEVDLYHIDLICERISPVFAMLDLRVSEFKSPWRDGVLGRDFLKDTILEINSIEGQAKIIT